jgi:hypothetical protein
VRARTSVTGVALHTSPDEAGDSVALPRGTIVEILAETGRLRRVRTGSGLHGFVAAWLLEPLPAPSTGASGLGRSLPGAITR